MEKHHHIWVMDHDNGILVIVCASSNVSNTSWWDFNTVESYWIHDTLLVQPVGVHFVSVADHMAAVSCLFSVCGLFSSQQ